MPYSSSISALTGTFGFPASPPCERIEAPPQIKRVVSRGPLWPRGVGCACKEEVCGQNARGHHDIVHVCGPVLPTHLLPGHALTPRCGKSLPGREAERHGNKWPARGPPAKSGCTVHQPLLPGAAAKPPQLCKRCQRDLPLQGLSEGTGEGWEVTQRSNRV